MKNLLINVSYYIVLGFKYFYIAITGFCKYFYLYSHNIFSFLFNKLSKYFGWNKRFYYAGETLPDNALLNQIKSFFSKKPKKQKSTTDYKQKYLKAQTQSDKNFSRYQYRKSQEQKFNQLYLLEKKKNDDVLLKNKALLSQIKALKSAQANSAPTSGFKPSNFPDNRTAMQIMGLKSGFTEQELKKAYKRLTSRYHPDNHLHMCVDYIKEAEIELKKIQKAYNTLK